MIWRYISRHILPFQENIVKMKSILAILVIALLAVSCAPKAEKSVAATPAAVAAAPAEIKDVATWTTAYDAVITSYSETAAKVNAGDPTAMTKAEEISKTADALDLVAETIRASLSGQEQTDFAAKMLEYKDKFKAAASS
jgi:PBP1b-binding outer membrane lipoprotein LpoB